MKKSSTKKENAFRLNGDRAAGRQALGKLSRQHSRLAKELRDQIIGMRARQAELKLITDNSAVMLAHCGRDLRYKFVNQAYCKGMGLTPEQIVGRLLPDVLGEAAWQTIRPHVEEALLGRSVEYEAEVPYAGPGPRFVHVANTPETNEAGEVVGWVAAITDITERKHEQQRIQVRDVISRELAEAASLPLAAPRILQVLCELTGWDVGALWLEAADGKKLECVEFWNRPLEKVPTFETETRGRKFAPGEMLPGQIWCTGEAAVFEDLEHEPNFLRRTSALKDGLKSAVYIPIPQADRITGVVECFSRRQQHSEPGLLKMLSAVGYKLGQYLERERAQQELRRSEERLRHILSTSLDAIITIDSSGCITGWNPQAEDLFGWKYQEVVGLKMVTIIIPARFRPAYERSLDHYLKTGKSLLLERRFEAAALHRGGREFPVELALTPLLLENQLAFCAFVRDITERIQSQQRLAADLDAMKRLRHLGTLFAREDKLEPVLAEIVEAAIAIAGADFGNIQLINPATGHLQIVAQIGFERWWVDYWNGAGGGKGTCGTALVSHERVIVEDVKRSPIFTGPALEMQLRAGIRAVQATPLISRSGTPLGMFSTHYRTPHKPGEQALRLLDLLARQAADIIERAQAEETLRRSHVELEERVRERTVDLRDANEKLKEAFLRMNDLYHRAPCGYHSLDANGRFIEINDTALQWLGYTREELIGKKTVFDLESRVSRKIGRQAFEKLKRGKAAVNLELEFVRKDGSRLTVLLNASAVLDAAGTLVKTRSAFVNITERKHAEAALQASETRFRGFIESAPDAVVIADGKGRIHLVNAQTERMFGYQRDELLGQPLEMLMPKRFRRGHQSHRAHYLGAPRVRAMRTGLDLFGLRKNGDEFPIEILLSPLSTDSGQLVCAAIRDVTARKRLEAALLESKRHYMNLFKKARLAHLEMQRLSQLVHRAQEEERARISRELHDDLGQTLTAATMMLKGLGREICGKQQVNSVKLQEVMRLLLAAMDRTHDFARELRPNMLDELGLLPALRSLAHGVANNAGLRLYLRADPAAEQLPGEEKLALFRIAQECINNVVKHAHASRLNLTVAQASAGIVLRVTDNGQSFRSKRIVTLGRRHLGLVGMKERARLVKGDFTIQGRLGKGTTVRVWVPFKPYQIKKTAGEVRAHPIAAASEIAHAVAEANNTKSV